MFYLEIFNNINTNCLGAKKKTNCPNAYSLNTSIKFSNHNLSLASFLIKDLHLSVWIMQNILQYYIVGASDYVFKWGSKVGKE